MSYPWGRRLESDHPTRTRWAEARAAGWDLRQRVQDALRRRPLNKNQLYEELVKDRCLKWSLQDHFNSLDPMLNDLSLDGLVRRVEQDEAVAAGAVCEGVFDTWWSWWMLTDSARSPQRVGGVVAVDLAEASNPAVLKFEERECKRAAEKLVADAGHVLVGPVDVRWFVERVKRGERVEEPWVPGEPVGDALRLLCRVEAESYG